MDRFEELLLRIRQTRRALLAESTPQCPSEETLFALVNEPKPGSLEEREWDHVVTCPYCIQVLRAALPEPEAETGFVSERNSKIFPLAEELNLHKATSLTLYLDFTELVVSNRAAGVAKLMFDIDSPGFYHAEIDTGQVVWSRDIESGDFTLTEEEQSQVLSSGMAADTEDLEPVVAFRDSLWNGRLEVTLVKRVNNARLVFHFKDFVK